MSMEESSNVILPRKISINDKSVVLSNKESIHKPLVDQDSDCNSQSRFNESDDSYVLSNNCVSSNDESNISTIHGNVFDVIHYPVSESSSNE